MLDLKDDNHPAKRVTRPRPLTPLQKEQGLVFLMTFMLWLPVYLIWVRPAINSFLFRFIDSYPAMLHLVPIMGVPWALTEVYGRFREASGRHTDGHNAGPQDHTAG